VALLRDGRSRRGARSSPERRDQIAIEKETGEAWHAGSTLIPTKRTLQMRATTRTAALAAAVLLGLQAATGRPAGATCQIPLVDEPFNGTALAAGWEVQSGKGSYALTGTALRYTIDAYGWVPGSEPLRLVRAFTGDRWTLRTHVFTDLRPAEPVNNRILHFQLRAGDRNIAHIMRQVGAYDANPNSNSLMIEIGDALRTVIFPNMPTALTPEIWLWQIERNGDSITVLANNDSDNDFEYSFGPVAVPGLASASQEIVIMGTGWWGSNDPPGTASFHDITVDTQAAPGCNAQVWRRSLAGSGRSLAVDPADNAVVLTDGSPPALTKYGPSGSIRWRRSAIGGVRAVAAGAEGITVAGNDPPRLARYDGGGRLLWKRTLGEVSAGAVVAAMVRSPDGTLVVFAVEADGEAARLIKYDGNGFRIWQRELGPYEWIPLHLYGLAVGPRGHIAPLSSYNWGYFAHAYASNGRLLWQQQVGGDEDDQVAGIVLDAAGGVAIAGGSVDWGASETLFAWVKRHGTDGTRLWQADVLRPRDSADVGAVRSVAVAIGADGRHYLVGNSRGAWAGEPMSVVGNAEQDIFVARLSPDGRRLWEKRLRRAGDQDARALRLDSRGNLLVLSQDALIKLTP
jgi:hypothetical protein